MSKSDFARAIGVTPAYVTMLLWDNPPWPGREVQRRIAEVTKGYVTPNMWAGYKSPAGRKPKRKPASDIAPPANDIPTQQAAAE